MVHGPAALVSTRSLLQTQNPRGHSRTTKSECVVSQGPRQFVWTLKFEKHCLTRSLISFANCLKCSPFQGYWKKYWVWDTERNKLEVWIDVGRINFFHGYWLSLYLSLASIMNQLSEVKKKRKRKKGSTGVFPMQWEKKSRNSKQTICF